MDTSTMQDVAAVTAVINEIYNQYSSSYNAEDIDQWVSLWTDDGVQMPPDSPWVIGKEQIRAANKGFLDQVTVDAFDITNEEVRVAGDWAYARGAYTVTFISKAAGEAIVVDGKYMTIFEKQPDGSWKIHRDIFNSNVPSE